jgi:hypothetical protein
MFDSKQTLTTRLTDAVDLMIDFATLGEYGLEPVGRTPLSCETRRRTAPSGAQLRRRDGAQSADTHAPRRRHQIDGPFLLRP